MVRRDRNVNLDLTITGLVVGTHVMVVGTEAVLLRAFERFDWWDRPNAEGIDPTYNILSILSITHPLDVNRNTSIDANINHNISSLY